MWNLVPALLVVLLTSAVPRATATEPKSVADGLVGSWEGEGNLFGRDASFHMRWEWILDHQFLELSFRNGMKTPDGVDPVLEARAVYRELDDGSWEGTWYDTRGVIQPLRGDVDGATLTVQWGSPDTEEGRTVYRLLDGGTVEVDDLVKKGEEWVTFGNATYQRTDRP